MVEELPEGMVGDGKSTYPKKTIITVLIFAFGILLFLGGVQLGKIVQYQIDVDQVDYFRDNCVCPQMQELIAPSLGSWNVS